MRIRFGKKGVLWFTGMTFLIISLLPGFTQQLNKLPFLVNHYRHHIEEEGPITVSEFIALHYGEGSTHKEKEDHTDLPFFQQSNTHLVVITQEIESIMFLLPHTFSHEHGAPAAQFYSYNHIGGIFQPPRTA